MYMGDTMVLFYMYIKILLLASLGLLCKISIMILGLLCTISILILGLLCKISIMILGLLCTISIMILEYNYTGNSGALPEVSQLLELFYV